MKRGDIKTINNTYNYALHHVVFPLRITKDGVVVWCDTHHMTDNYTDGHMTFQRQHAGADMR